MKKLILLTAIFATLNSNAFAKTEGSYLGIDVVRNSINVDTSSNSPEEIDKLHYNHKTTDNSYGVGLSYKHAFNFDNFFIAPAISYNLINSEAKSSFQEILPNSQKSYLQKTKVESQVNLQANFGYDVTDNFAFYIPVGASLVRYQVDTDDRYKRTNGSGYSISKKLGRETVGFIGLGFSYQIAKNLVMNLEYNKFQEIEVKSPQATLNDSDINTKINLDSVKLGLAYKF